MADELLHVLSADLEAAEADGPRLSEAELRRLFEAMVTARALDRRCARLHAAGEIGFYVASQGEEAALGAAAALRVGDWVFPSHRDPGTYLLRGGSLRSWLDQLFGNDADLTQGRQLPGHHSLPDGRFVSVSSPLGTQIVQAAGCAMAMKIRGDDSVVLASFGGAATSSSDFHTALNLAASFTAPLVFLCRKVDLPPDAAGPLPPPGSLTGHAVACGLETARVDGTDVLAVLQAVAAARDHALLGAGATLIEAVGMGPDADPIGRFRAYLEACGTWDAARQEALDMQLDERLDEAVAAAAAAPRPAPDSLFVDVYSELPWMLQEQRGQLFDEEDRGDV